MDFNEYQQAAMSTAIFKPEYEIIYPTMKLCGEAGEVAEKIAKVYRDQPDARVYFETPEFKQAIKKELGDVLWYIAAISRTFKIDLSDVAESNIAKLADRKARGVINGSGDER